MKLILFAPKKRGFLSDGVIEILLNKAEDLVLILPKFDEYMYLSELKLWLPYYSDFIDLFDKNSTVLDLIFDVNILLEKSITI